jgi:hypothetical protein
MKKEILFLVLMFLPLVSAANINYIISDNKVLVEIELGGGDIDLFEFPEDYELSGGTLKYFDKGLIEKDGRNYFFISKSEIHPNSQIKVILPKGASLNKNYFIFPREYGISTDGENIILNFNETREKEIFIPYTLNKEIFWFYILGGLFALYLGITFFQFKKGESKKYTQNLYREEKKIMDYILKKKECWTKEISRDLDIPKVRLSRKIRNLVEKGLIEKIPYGNENKIKIKR